MAKEESLRCVTLIDTYETSLNNPTCLGIWKVASLLRDHNQSSRIDYGVPRGDENLSSWERYTPILFALISWSTPFLSLYPHYLDTYWIISRCFSCPVISVVSLDVLLAFDNIALFILS